MTQTENVFGDGSAMMLNGRTYALTIIIANRKSNTFRKSAEASVIELANTT